MLENRLFSDPRATRNLERCLKELEAAQRDLERIAQEERYPALAQLREAVQWLTTSK